MPVVREESFQRRCVAGIKTRGGGLTVTGGEDGGDTEIQKLPMVAVLSPGGGGESAFLWVLKNQLLKTSSSCRGWRGSSEY